jgi:zinc transport system ATP-binding protein
MDAAVLLQEISFAYQNAPVLKNVTFEIGQKEFWGMIGPNGGGKTTLLKLMMGFLKPDAGKIALFGKSPVQARPHIAYVPQSLRFDKHFPISVLELVLEGRLSQLPWYGQYSTADKAAALDALEKVGMADFRHRPFGGLSGGQAQRTLIARALASAPQLLLLDEPTASVDAQAAASLYTLLKQLQGEITILMVTHHLQAAIDLVEKVICVEQTAAVLNPDQVCRHFAFGLYHLPLNTGRHDVP